MKQISCLVLKVLSICFFVKSFSNMPIFLSAVLPGKEDIQYRQDSILPYSIPVIITLTISILLWIYAEKIAERLLKKTKTTVKISVSLNGLQAVAFSAIGIIIVFTTLPQWIDQIIKISHHLYLNDRTALLIQSNIILYSMKLLLGIILTLGAKWIVQILKKIGSASFYKYEDEVMDIEDHE